MLLIVTRLSERNKFDLDLFGLMKLILFFLFLISSTKWMENYYLFIIPFQNYKVLSYDKSPIEIAFRVNCKPLCGVYLLSDFQYLNFNTSFQYLFGLGNTQSIQANVTDINLIRNGLNLLILNNQTDIIEAQVYQDVNYDDLNWIPIYILFAILGIILLFCFLVCCISFCVILRCFYQPCKRKDPNEVLTGVDATELI